MAATKALETYIVTCEEKAFHTFSSRALICTIHLQKVEIIAWKFIWGIGTSADTVNLDLNIFEGPPKEYRNMYCIAYYSVRII